MSMAIQSNIQVNIMDRNSDTSPSGSDTPSTPGSNADGPPLSPDRIDQESRQVPNASVDSEAAPSPADTSHPDTETYDKEKALDDLIAILLRDGLDQPIANLPVKIEMPGQPAIEATTDEKGAVVLPASEKKDGHITVSVKDVGGEHQEVCKIDLAKCQGGGAIVRSPKVKATLPLKPHQQKAPSALPPQPGKPAEQPKKAEAAHGLWYSVSEMFGTAWHWLHKESHPQDRQPPAGHAGKEAQVAKQTINKAGNPIIAVVGPECPNKENLRLGRNNIYRAEIIKAGERVGLIPQAIAALIDAEAAPITDTIPALNPDGTPKIIQKGKNKGKPVVLVVGQHWDAHSGNATGAAGLTQFLVSTWLGQVMKPGYFIHEQSVAKGWVKQEADKQGKLKWVFVLADGKTTPTPWAHKGDANVKVCLNQRYVPEWSIMAAADYGKANLRVLKDKGFKIFNLNDAEKAKLMYLMHHEGEGAGPLVIANKLSHLPKGKFATVEARIRDTFVKQVGEKKARNLIEDNGGDIAKAYREWIADYVDRKIIFKHFSCDASKLPEPADALALFKKIGGEK